MNQDSGKLTKKQRVLVAQDVLSTLRSRQKKFVLQSTYFDTSDADIPESGQLTSRRIKGQCGVCARGLLFIKSVDRFDNCDILEMKKMDDGYDSWWGLDWGEVAKRRTTEDWGLEQARLIEVAFEGGVPAASMLDEEVVLAANAFRKIYHKRGSYDRKALMIAICKNIEANAGIFNPESDLPKGWEDSAKLEEDEWSAW